jgi:uncharacterized protein DUF5906
VTSHSFDRHASDDRRRFLAAVLPDTVEGQRCAWRIQHDEDRDRKLSDYAETTADLGDVIDRYDPDSADIYVGAAVYGEARPSHQRPRCEDVVAVPSLRADTDVGKSGNPADLDELVRRLKNLPIPPTAIVGSGNGAQPWWRLREAADPKEAEGVLRGLTNWGGDAAATDLARVLRVPGTLNLKDPAHPKPVRLLYLDHAREADLSEFIDLGIYREAEPRKRVTVAIDGEIPEMVRVALEEDARLRKAWAGDGYESPSEADLALVSLLIRHHQVDDANALATAITLRRIEAGAKPKHRAYFEATVGKALAGAQRPQAERQGSAALAEFYGLMLEHKFIHTPSGDLWPVGTVNSRFPKVTIGTDGDGHPVKLLPSQWIDRNRPVEQMTWSPGDPQLIEDRLVSLGGWFDHSGARVFNSYRPSTITPGDAEKAGPWVDHVARVYPDETAHLIQWFAHRVQRPGEKLNHAIALGGNQGIGKDTILFPVRYAAGPWNCLDVYPATLMGRFNGFLKAVILVVSEARDLGDVNRYALYDHMKSYTASPPEVLRINEKNRQEFYIPNLCGVVVTTNYKDGLYIPPDDRRHFVAWSELSKEDFDPDYWHSLYQWFEAEGNRHVAAYLRAVDLVGFDPKAPPPKTAAWHELVDSSQAPEGAEAADAIDALGNPQALTIAALAERSAPDFADWLGDRANRRLIPHRMRDAGYVPERNPDAKDGLWKISKRRQVIYVRGDISPRDRLNAARHLAKGTRG